MTVNGMRHTPLTDRANMPRNMASNGPGSPDVKFDFNQCREEKYSPTPGTQRVIDWNKNILQLLAYFVMPNNKHGAIIFHNTLHCKPTVISSVLLSPWSFSKTCIMNSGTLFEYQKR